MSRPSRSAEIRPCTRDSASRPSINPFSVAIAASRRRDRPPIRSRGRADSDDQMLGVAIPQETQASREASLQTVEFEVDRPPDQLQIVAAANQDQHALIQGE